MTLQKSLILLVLLILGVHGLKGTASTEMKPQGGLTSADSEPETLQISFLHPQELQIEEGDTLILEAQINGGVGSIAYRWETPAGPINASSPKLVFPLATSYDQGTYTLTVSDAEASSSLSVVVSVASRPPDAPLNSTAIVPNGDTVYLRVGHLPPPDRSWSWFLNGRPLPDGNLGIFAVPNVSFDKVGTYELVQFNPNETIYSAKLVIAESKLTNMSVRNALDTINESTTLGFVTIGQPNGYEPASTLLLRSIGPTLVDYGVSSAHPDPILSVYGIPRSGLSPVLLASNDDWAKPVNSNDAGNADTQFMRELGAFELSDDSKDAALTLFQNEGSITTMVGSNNQRAGIVLNEIFISESSPITLTNASVLSETGADEETLIVGFVVTGEWPLRLLIRGIGPSLTSHGVEIPVSNPKLKLFDAERALLLNNDNWGQASNSEEIQMESARVGAFPINPDSNDAVILETLSPGLYTIHLEAIGETSGTGLIEIYTVR